MKKFQRRNGMRHNLNHSRTSCCKL